MDRTLLGPSGMTRFLLPLGAATAAVLLSAPTAVQAQMVSICPISVGGDLDLITSCNFTQPIGIEDCQAAAPIRFQADRVPSGASVLDFWRGDNCSAVEQRGPDGTCVHLTEAETAGTMFQFDVPAPELVDCETDHGVQTPTIWVFATDESMEQGMVDPAAIAQIALPVDTRRPAPPEDVEGGAGDTAIPISWDIPAGNTDLFSHRIYVAIGGELVGGGELSADAGALPDGGAMDDAGSADDAGATTDAGPDAGPDDAGTGTDGGPTDAGPDGSLPSMFLPIADDGGLEGGTLDGGGGLGCSPGPLQAGLFIEGEPFLTVGESVAAASLNGAELGLDFGQTAAIVVTAVDEAGNESPTSNVACITRVQTVGFCDRIGGCEEDGCTCRAAPGAPRPGAATAMAAGVALGALVWFRRRRKR